MNLNQINDKTGFDLAKTAYGFGFAIMYLQNHLNKQTTKNMSDISIFKKLVEIDFKLGATVLEQLNWCLNYSTRSDLIKVCLKNPTIHFKH